MPTYKTKGIIIRRKNFGETDRMLTIYTKNHGKIRVVAKGVRKTLSKLGGHLELFYLVDLMLAEGKNLDIITSAQIMKSFKNIRRDKDLINRTYYISELVDLATQLEADNQEIFELLIESLNNLDKDEKILRYFELKLISILGHYPELTTCVICKKSLEYKYHGFSYSRGGIVCSNCNNFLAKEISPETIKFMRLLTNKSWDFIKRIRIDEKISSELKKINQEILDHIIEREIKSKKFL